MPTAEARQNSFLPGGNERFTQRLKSNLAQYSRTLRSSLENLWEKYHQPLHNIMKEMDAASVELAGYLKELGYE